MKKIGFLLLILGCGDRIDGLEKGVVVDQFYTPSHKVPKNVPTYDSKGNFSGIETVQVTNSEEYLALLKCEHGIVYSISGVVVQKLMAQAAIGDSVVIFYHHWGNIDFMVTDSVKKLSKPENESQIIPK